MTSVQPKAPYVGSILDWPVNPAVRRSYYTESTNALTKIAEDESVMPDIVKNAQPRLGDNSLLDILQKVLQSQSSEKQEVSMPSNLDYRK
jgi:hypothetical protein